MLSKRDSKIKTRKLFWFFFLTIAPKISITEVESP